MLKNLKIKKIFGKFKLNPYLCIMNTKQVTFDEAIALGISSENHLSEAPKEVFEAIYNMILEEPTGKSRGVEIKILSWNDTGKDPMVCLHYIDGKMYWEPWVESLIHIDNRNTWEAKVYQYGYIDGRRSHLGPISKGMTSATLSLGYVLWAEFN